MAVAEAPHRLTIHKLSTLKFHTEYHAIVSSVSFYKLGALRDAQATASKH